MKTNFDTIWSLLWILIIAVIFYGEYRLDVDTQKCLAKGYPLLTKSDGNSFCVKVQDGNSVFILLEDLYAD